MFISSIIREIKVYFNILPDRENEQEIIAQISSGVSFKGAIIERIIKVKVIKIWQYI